MLPPYLKKQIEKMLMTVVLTAIEKVVEMPPDKQQAALEDLREQVRTGKVKPGALISFNL